MKHQDPLAVGVLAFLTFVGVLIAINVWPDEPISGWVTPEHLWPLLPALAGTLVGAGVTFVVQLALKWVDRRNTLQDRIAVFVLIVTGIRADMENILGMLDGARLRAPKGTELYRAVHTLPFTKSVSPDLTQVEPFIRLKSRALVEKAAYLCTEHARISDLIAEYNKLKIQHSEVREEWRLQGKVDRLSALEDNLKVYINFISEVSNNVLTEAEDVLWLIGSVSESHFGKIDFLRLD